MVLSSHTVKKKVPLHDHVALEYDAGDDLILQVISSLGDLRLLLKLLFLYLTMH